MVSKPTEDPPTGVVSVKWVLGVVMSLVGALLAWWSVSISSGVGQAQQTNVEQSTSIAVLKEQITNNRATLVRIESKLDRVIDDLNDRKRQ